jgi:hypothetical protein
MFGMSSESIEDIQVSENLINHLKKIAEEDKGSDFHKSFCEAWDKVFKNEGEPKKDSGKTDLPILFSETL